MNPADLFSHQTDTINLAPGALLFQAGDAGDAMFVVLEGTLEIRVGDKVVETSTRGAIIGEMALIDQAPRIATVTAKEPARLVKIDQRRFHFLIQQTPFFATHVMKVLTERLRHMNQTRRRLKLDAARPGGYLDAIEPNRDQVDRLIRDVAVPEE